MCVFFSENTVICLLWIIKLTGTPPIAKYSELWSNVQKFWPSARKEGKHRQARNNSGKKLYKWSACIWRNLSTVREDIWMALPLATQSSKHWCKLQHAQTVSLQFSSCSARLLSLAHFRLDCGQATYFQKFCATETHLMDKKHKWAGTATKLFVCV